MKVAVALVLVALLLLGFSTTMPPYRLMPDGSDWDSAVAYGNSTEYFEAWERARTAKYRLQDYGVLLLGCGIVCALLHVTLPIKAPASRLGFLVLAIVAPVASVAGYLFDLLLGMFRREFPPWADSIGIPLTGAPVLLLIGVAWGIGHFMLLAGVPRRAGVALSIEAIRRGHPWLIAVIALTTLLIVMLAAEGAYWYVFPGTIWLYMYVSIAAVRYQHDA